MPPSTNLIISAKSINFSDFDFDIDRIRMSAAETHDASVTVRRPGKHRKTAHHELIFIPYFKKYRLKFKTVAIGKHRHGKKRAPIIVFDEPGLSRESAIIRKYSETIGLVNSKGHALKMLEMFNIPAPKKANAVTRVLFQLHPAVVKGNKLNYRICAISVLKVINDESKAAPYEREKKGKRKTGKAGSKATANEPSPTSANIL